MRSSAEAIVDVPRRCPFCGSATITAASQKVTAATYWRCEGCSQLWHPERLRTTQRPIR